MKINIENTILQGTVLKIIICISVIAPNLSIDEDRSTYIFFGKKKTKKINPERLLIFKTLQVGPQMHQSTSLTPPTRGLSTGAIWNNCSFLRLYKLVDTCTSQLGEHLPCVDNPCMQFRTTPCF